MPALIKKSLSVDNLNEGTPLENAILVAHKNGTFSPEINSNSPLISDKPMGWLFSGLNTVSWISTGFIRSLLNYKNISEIAVASGVILGSTAIKEYNENFIKAKSLLDIFKSWFIL